MRLDDIEELGHDRGHPTKVAGPEHPAQRPADVVHLNGGLKALWIHLWRFRGEERIGADLFQQATVLLQVARVGGKIRPLVELDGVDEDRHHDHVAPPFPFAHQAQMAFVQKSHGGHKGDLLPFQALGL